MPNHVTTTAREWLLVPVMLFVIHLMFTELSQHNRPVPDSRAHPHPHLLSFQTTLQDAPEVRACPSVLTGFC